MHLAIVGYGKMGQQIAAIAAARGHSVTTVDPHHPQADLKDITELALKNIDCAIEFTSPTQVLSNIATLTKLKINQIIGTTGWYDQIPNIKQQISESQVGLLYAANFSLGVNAFMRIVEVAAAVFNNLPEYDISGIEWHHNRKADSPSGTGIKLAEILLEQLDRKTQLLTEECDREIQPNELHFASVRCGHIPGTHEIVFDSPADSISLKHTARSREGFALGAVVAAEWLQGKKGFYEISDLVNDLLRKSA